MSALGLELLKKLFPYVVGLGLLLFALFWAYGKGEAATQAEWDADTVLRNAKQIALLEVAQTKLTQAGVQHDIDQSTIDNLTERVVLAERVRLHFPTPRGCASPSSAASSANPASGVVSNPVDGLFADFQERVGGLIQRCDQLNIDVVRLNGELK